MIKNNADKETVIDYKVNSKTSGTNGIYTTTATEGSVPVYYFRGDADKVNNNIIFNNMCWKIIRTTETGGVKIIYYGIPTNGKCETIISDTTTIGKSAFNENYKDNAYVGYMYGTAGSSTYDETHANTNDSIIKTYIDNWYSKKFDETATSKLEDTVFCNDRSTKAYDTNTIGDTSMSSYGALGYGTNKTLYGAAHRVSRFSKTPNPSLVCAQNNDKFTVDSKNGNGALTYPVGLITADEIVFAGYVSYYSGYGDSKNYLYTGRAIWTLSPINNYQVAQLQGGGIVDQSSVNYQLYVRPVVSLKSGTLITGDGTSTSPFVVK